MDNELNMDRIQKLVSVYREYKKLGQELEGLKGDVKADMTASKINTITQNGVTVSLTRSQRNTPAKDILVELAGLGLTSCIMTQMVPDIDRLRLEVGTGLTQEQFAKLVKVSEVLTLNIK